MARTIMDVKNRSDMRDYFIKDLKKSVNKLRAELRNSISAIDRMDVFQTLDVDYNESDMSQSIENLISYMKKGYPKTTEVTTKREEPMQVEDSYILVTNPDDFQLTINSELQDKYPAMGPTTYAKTKESIAKFGMRNPVIVTPEKMLIDGHHRYKIWRELYNDGVRIPLKYQVKVFENDEEISTFIKDMNEHRRHLSIVEASLQAAEEYIQSQEEGDKKSLRDVAAKYDVSPAMVHAAKEVLTSDDEEVKEAVETGQKHPLVARDELKEKKAKKIAQTIESKLDETAEKVVNLPVRKKQTKDEIKIDIYKTMRESYFFILMDKYDESEEENVRKHIDIYEKDFLDIIDSCIKNPA